MKQVLQSYRDGRLALAEVPEPACQAGGAVVVTQASLISVGTEKHMIEMGRKSLVGKARARPDLVRQAWAKARKEGFWSVFKEALHRLDEPVPLGYSASGVVREVGPGVRSVTVGQPVAMVGAGYASHAEVVWVPENLLAPLPPGVDFEAGAFGMLGCIALHGVREAELTLGETAAVIGLGLLGLLTVQLLKAQGCQVIGVEPDQEKARLALELGADQALPPEAGQVLETVLNATGGLGADAVVITAASKDHQPLLLAESIARPRARIVLVGTAELKLTRKTFWEKELRFSVSKAAGPGSLSETYEVKGLDYPPAYVRWTEGRNLEAFLRLVAQGKVRVDPLISHRFPIAEALEAYDLILENRAPYLGVLLTYPPVGDITTKPAERTLRLEGASKGAAPGPGKVGFIGGGRFTKNILLPALRQVGKVSLGGIATRTGPSGLHLAQKYGFAYATTDYQELLADPDIDRVIITTPHHLHARQVVEALKAGKMVLVEKPLALTEEELAEIQAAYDGARLLLVGFNRRFAPLAREVKEMLSGRQTPLVMLYRVNAGYIPQDSWVHDPERGGGRLLGEVCHFIDFLHFMAGAVPREVQVKSISGVTGKYLPEDNLILTLSFADGSVGTIVYTAKGTKAFSRERFEVYGEEAVGIIEDFRRAELVSGGRRRLLRKFSMDLGYRDELAFFLNPQPPPPEVCRKLFEEYLWSSRATLKAAVSLRSGERVSVEDPGQGTELHRKDRKQEDERL